MIRLVTGWTPMRYMVNGYGSRHNTQYNINALLLIPLWLRWKSE